MFVNSGQAEILRASQKDENFLIQFHDLFTELLQGVLGVRIWIKFRDAFKICSNVLYHSLTTLSNSQTLGEEYTGIFQVHSSGQSLQKKHVQLIMILLDACGEKVFVDSLKKFEKYIENLPMNHPLKLHVREKLVNLSVNLRSTIPFLQRLHKAIFYLNGAYYHFGKRVTNTRYVLVRHWLKDKSTVPAFKLLGIISFIHLAFNVIFELPRKESVKNVEKSVAKNYEGVGTGQSMCPLCLNPYQNLSAIPCGHVFCWDCIISWLQEQPQCPLCRRMAQPSRVVFIQNYRKR